MNNNNNKNPTKESIIFKYEPQENGITKMTVINNKSGETYTKKLKTAPSIKKGNIMKTLVKGDSLIWEKKFICWNCRSLLLVEKDDLQRCYCNSQREGVIDITFFVCKECKTENIIKEDLLFPLLKDHILEVAYYPPLSYALHAFYPSLDK